MTKKVPPSLIDIKPFMKDVINGYLDPCGSNEAEYQAEYNNGKMQVILYGKPSLKQKPTLSNEPGLAVAGHWGFYLQKIGLVDLNKINPVQYSMMQQTFYAGALALAAIMEQRKIDLDQIQDVIQELIQFTSSQSPAVEEKEESKIITPSSKIIT